MNFKQMFTESVTPSWDIKSQKWINASKDYIEAQEDILDDLKKLKSKKDAVKLIRDEFGNRDFDIVDGTKMLVSVDDSSMF